MIRTCAVAIIGCVLLVGMLIPGASSTRAASTIPVDAGRGPVSVYVPTSYDPDVPAPLLIMLHGYGSTGPTHESWFQLGPYAEAYGYIYTYPSGEIDSLGNRYWDATTFCCDIDEPNGPEDSIYLGNLMAAIEAELNVDSQRIYFIGHSNGGVMSFRMACDHSEKIAAVVSVSGPMYLTENANNDPVDGEDFCQPKQPVHILQVHGTLDGTLNYHGGWINFPGTQIHGKPYPGARESVDIWSEFHNLCNKNIVQSGGTLNLDGSDPDAETDILRWPSKCHVAGSTEHWRFNEGGHSTENLTDEFRARVFTYLDTHPKEYVRFTDKTTLTWPVIPVAHSYKVYRGYLSDLHDVDDDGQPDMGYGDCQSPLDPDETDTMFVDPDEPPADEGYFYPISYVDNISPLAGGRKEGGLGKTGAGQHRENLAPCP